MFAQIKRLGLIDGKQQLETLVYYVERSFDPLNVDLKELGTFAENAIPLPEPSETVVVEYFNDEGLTIKAREKPEVDARWSPVSWSGALFDFEQDLSGYAARKTNPFAAVSKGVELIPLSEYVDPANELGFELESDSEDKDKDKSNNGKKPE